MVGMLHRSEVHMLSESVSFKRVFLYASMMFMGIGAALVLYLGMTEAGNAIGEASYSSAAYDVQPAPAAPVQEPVYPPPPATFASLPVLLPPEVQEPIWPQSLTFHEARENPSYYRAWLEAKNPGIHFQAIHAVVTGYCPCPLCCGSGAHGVTRTGVHTSAEPYGIAGPEALLRRGVHIPGYLFESAPAKVWKTDDTGGALNDDWADHVYHFDVRFTSHDWAKRWWGRREMTVYLVQ